MKQVTFQTKFNLGDTIFAFDSSTLKLIRTEVKCIDFMLSKKELNIFYYGVDGTIANEIHCFATEEEFIKKIKP